MTGKPAGASWRGGRRRRSRGWGAPAGAPVECLETRGDRGGGAPAEDDRGGGEPLGVFPVGVDGRARGGGGGEARVGVRGPRPRRLRDLGRPALPPPVETFFRRL